MDFPLGVQPGLFTYIGQSSCMLLKGKGRSANNISDSVNRFTSSTGKS